MMTISVNSAAGAKGNEANFVTDSSGNVVGLTTPDGTNRYRLRGPRKAAIMGDSIALLNLNISSGAGSASAFRGTGYLGWALARLGWPWDIQTSDQFAVDGTGFSVVNGTQLTNLKAAHLIHDYDRVFISCGTNDLWTNGYTLAQMVAGYETLFGEIANLGITPVHIGILPRGVSGGVTNNHKISYAVNDWLANYAAKTGNLEFIPGVCEAIADNSAANGYLLSALTSDNTHPNDAGAYWMGNALYNYYAPMGLPSALRFAESQADQYDATYNPTGVCFDSPNPLLLGGTTAPTGMSTSGTNCSWAVGTRTIANGQSRATVNCTVSGATTNGYLYDDVIASGDWSSGDEIAVGDEVYAQAIVEVTTGAAGVRPWLSCTESNGVNSVPAYCLDYQSATIPAIPDGTILTMRTPNITVRDYGGSGNASVSAKLNIRSGGNSGLIKVRAFELRRVADY